MTLARRIINLQFRLATGDFGKGGADTVDLEGYRCSVNIVRAGIGYARADVQIWGMPLEMMNRLTVTQKTLFQQGSYNSLIISAGDEESGVAMCFGGNVLEAWADAREAPDVVFHVSAASGMTNLAKPIPPTSYKGSVDAALAISGIAEAMGYSFENSGVTGVLRNPYKPGTARDQIESLCRDVNCEVDIDDGKMVVAIWPKGGVRNGAAIRIAADTGMIGYPAFSQGGIQVSTIYNPNLQFGRKIEVESQFTAANGEWSIYGLAHRLEANVPGGQWFSDIETTYLDNMS